MENIFNEIKQERERQDKKWGVQNHHPFVWLGILGEEVGEVNKAVLDHNFDGKTLENYREELIQVAAVAVSMIQCLDRNNN
ncbi:MazG-like family protein [Myroides odoratus]|uniref:MazG-like family protein n=1 Tax=Myroides odoratus TaxID=256 RepID=UPI003341ED1E